MARCSLLLETNIHRTSGLFWVIEIILKRFVFEPEKALLNRLKRVVGTKFRLTYFPCIDIRFCLLDFFLYNLHRDTRKIISVFTK